METRNIAGKLLDPASRKVLATGRVSISLSWQAAADDRPSLSAMMVVDGYKPELDRKSPLLELSGGVSGEVFLYIAGIPDREHTPSR